MNSAYPEYHELTEQQRAPLEALFTEFWSEPWRDICGTLYAGLLNAPALADTELDEVAALAVDLLLAFAEIHGGRGFYLAKGSKGEAEARRQFVIGSWRGDNYDEIRRATGLTDRRIQQIISEHQKSRQRALFE